MSTRPNPKPLASAAPAAEVPGDLHFVSDRDPGIIRTASRRSFVYLRPDGSRIRRAAELARIKALVIPPAWTDVWICPDSLGHLQATGRDAKGRKQYQYHPLYRAARDEVKYDKLVEVGRALPRIRRRVDRDLARPGLLREKVLAAVVALLDTAHARIGNEEYRRSNGSYGLTTLRNRHVKIKGSTVQFQFKSKSGKDWHIELADRRLARIVKRCQELPGQVLFEYLDEEGEARRIESADVNAYLREISGGDITAKDFRTWAGTVIAAEVLDAAGKVDSKTDSKRAVVLAIDAAAADLGNTRSVCRTAYVHPGVVDAFENGRTIGSVRRRATSKLTRSEARLLSLIEEQETLSAS